MGSCGFEVRGLRTVVTTYEIGRFPDVSMVFVLTTTQSQHSRAIDAAFIPMLPIGLVFLVIVI
jgi:hypothetical protein